MKFLLTLSLSIFALGAFAADDLNAMKQSANSKIESQLSSLQKSKACVNNAATVDAFKACKVDMGTSTIQREEEKKEKKDKSMGDKVKDQYEETKEDLDDAI